MSKTVYVVKEKSYFYTDEYYVEIESGVPQKVFGTRDEAQKAAEKLDISLCRSGQYRIWETESCFENSAPLVNALQRIANLEVTWENVWDIDEAYLEEHLNDAQLSELLREISLSFHTIEEMEIEEIDSNVSVSEWCFVIKATEDLYGDSTAEGEIIGAYPFREVAERVIEDWFADNRLKTLGELCPSSQSLAEPFIANHIQEQMGEGFSLGPTPSEFDLSELDRNRFVKLLRLTGCQYLKIVDQ